MGSPRDRTARSEVAAFRGGLAKVGWTEGSALAARYGVPTIYFNRFFSELGGLITYGPDYAEQFRQVPEYIDRILKGEKACRPPDPSADKV